MKKIVAIILSFIVATNPMFVSAHTDAEIEKKIDEVGNKYLEFYRNGHEEFDVDHDMAFEATEEVAYADVNATAAERKNFLAPSETFMEDFNTEEYSPIEESGFKSAKTSPFSTFGADVDTASYSSLRRKLLEPLAYGNPYYNGIDDSAIRIEEMMNYFTYHYTEPAPGEKFGVTTNLCKCPWNDETLLLKIGIKAEETKEKQNGSNIVFLIDTSGSMFDFDKLPLVKKSLEILTEKLDENDTVSIVTYAGDERVALEGASGNDKEKILNVIDSLEAGGSTWGEGGINKAYEIAGKYYDKEKNNRVILCTDGDFNVGVSSEAALKELISKKRDSGVYFSCLGFGGGNYSDTTMETLADNGNGNYFYIDCEREAERALSEEFFSTIYTVAKDVKFQVEFNPKEVKGYRLIGYENREMSAEDFDNDKKDGGEVGDGQTVTVLYEVVPIDSDFEIGEPKSRYAGEDAGTEVVNDELLAINIRYKEPGEKDSVLSTYPIRKQDISSMDDDTSWAAGVAQAGMLMRDSEYAGTSSFDAVYDRLKDDSEIMDNDYKAEFLFMLRAMKNYKEKK